MVSYNTCPRGIETVLAIHAAHDGEFVALRRPVRFGDGLDESLAVSRRPVARAREYAAAHPVLNRRLSAMAISPDGAIASTSASGSRSGIDSGLPSRV